MLKTDFSKPITKDDILRIIDQLDRLSGFAILCHSSREQEVKSWKLPYKVMANEWTDKSLVDKDMIYVIPIDNKPFRYSYREEK